MNVPQPSKANQALTPVDEIGIIDCLIALAKRKKIVLGLPVLFAVSAALGSLFVPEVYKATTTILPSQQGQSSALSMLNQLGGFAGTTPGALNIRIPAELYVTMLKSSTVADNLIKRFELKKTYGLESHETTREALAHNSKIVAGKDGLIVIEVGDREPKRAAEIANAYVDELFKLSKKLALTEASHRRLFYERALQSTRDKLAEAEISFKSVSETSRPIDVRAQSRAIAETAGRLRAYISAKEIILGAMQAFVTVNNQEYNRGQQEIGAMRADLARFESSNPMAQGLGGKPAPAIVSENIQALHELQYYKTLHELLVNQYENARLDEAKDSPIVEILGEAVEPNRSAKSKRATIMLRAALVGLFIAVFGVLLFDVIRIGRRPEDTERLAKLKSYLRFK